MKEKIVGTGIDKNIFEEVNDLKKSVFTMLCS
jgi:hypothetical protein